MENILQDNVFLRFVLALLVSNLSPSIGSIGTPTDLCTGIADSILSILLMSWQMQLAGCYAG